jgi:hypothetical protein
MNNVIAFLFLCIPARIGLALASQYIPDKYLKLYGTLLLLIGLSFIYLFITNKRLYAPEVGVKAWWAQFRIIIGAFYIIAAIYSFQGKRNLIWIPLAMDIVFGIIIFTIKHSTNIEF